MEYNFREIEKKWQKFWVKNKTYKVTEKQDKPKYYVLDMFPYPSGAGLHVGHPLGYIASDIYSRYKRQKGYNVLHPMGYDAYGLPAEQYAIQTGQHPAVTTENNIARYREQLDKLGFSYDWSREVRTCEPKYYKWTQWAFIQMFNSYYCNDAQQARPITELISRFEQQGTAGLNVACTEELTFSAEEWQEYTEEEKQEILLNYRIAYLADSHVNWCPALGTVLANDEVINGLSERGGHPVEQRVMRQWSLRVSAYAQRLLNGLDQVDWTESLKETQRNWIGGSEGAEITFHVSPGKKNENDGAASDEFPLPSYFQGDLKKWNALSQVAAKVRQTDPIHTKLWDILSASNINYELKKDQPVAFFIADFLYPEKRLIIEITGLTPEDEEYKTYLRERLALLSKYQFQVVRISKEEIEEDPDGVVSRIKGKLNSIPLFDKESGLQSVRSSCSMETGEVTVDKSFTVFTTRADTIFGVTFMVLAPESELVQELTTPEQEEAVANYLEATKKRTERERMADKKVSGVFTGSYAINPFTNKEIPIWVADYVLAGYGTGAIMAVPAHDSRDYIFAKHFNLPVIPLIEGCDVSEESFDAKDGIMINSGFLNGLTVKQAIPRAIEEVEMRKLGKRRTNYRLRDAIFSRQRYWGEPFPVYYKGKLPYMIPLNKLPLELPEVDKFLPTESGEPPLGHATKWAWDTEKEEVTDTSRIDHVTVFPLELNTMPGFAGSSAYYLRYMDPNNSRSLVSKKSVAYWRNVDLYIGGTEHATGHLIYSRFWNKFLFDLKVSCEEEPFKKLINQGMIQGRSNFVYRINGTNTFVSCNLKDQYEVTPIHVDVNMVENDVLDIERFKNWNPEYASAEFILENGKYICGWAVEKMSKSMFNVVNPDDIVEKYGADTLRMYEMFLGPLEISKPWDTNGIDGVHRFLRKFWNLFYKDEPIPDLSDDKATPEELKSLHKLIKKVSYDIEHFSFNTSVSAFMICVNELTALKCNKREILKDLVVLIAPFAPHIAEELWHRLGNNSSVCDAEWPEYKEEYLAENSFTYSISFNGKSRFNMDFAADASKEEIEAAVLKDERSQKWMDGKTPKKIIIVPKKIVNIVI
ncbi:MAG: leucine--tRNA ligase [Candidatus Azobacteroides sp.]|nr:leucine--tRNA ligase [Candidatus Azobacteroides sp.]